MIEPIVTINNRVYINPREKLVRKLLSIFKFEFVNVTNYSLILIVTGIYNNKIITISWLKY